MKKNILIIILAMFLLSNFVNAQNAAKYTEFSFTPDTITRYETSDIHNLRDRFESWPQESAASIRITTQGINYEMGKNIRFEVYEGQGQFIIAYTPKYDDHVEEIRVYVEPNKKFSIRAIYDYDQGHTWKSNPLRIDKLRDREVCTATLSQNTILSNISVETDPAGVTVFIDDKEKGVTENGSLNISKVSHGSHKLTLKKGNDISTKIINVDYKNVVFGPYDDLLKKKTITIKSEPSDAQVYIERGDNDEQWVGRTPCSTTLTHGYYVISVRKTSIEQETKRLDITDASEDVLNFKLVKKKSIEFSALYEGRQVDANLFISGMQSTTTQKGRVELEYNKSFDVRVTYDGQSKSDIIFVKKNSPTYYRFNIPPKRSTILPWQIAYADVPFGIVAGFVAKRWSSKNDNAMYEENIWGDRGLVLPGVQLGIQYKPCTEHGFGLYTGLFYEYYFSSKAELIDQGYYDKFRAHELYLPIHASFRLPLAQGKNNRDSRFGLLIHSGIGMNYALKALFTTKDEEYQGSGVLLYKMEDPYKRFVFSVDVGLGIRLGPVQIDASFSKGLNTVHKGDDYKITQNKWTLGASYVFSDVFWDNDYDQYPFAFVAGYVSKQYIIKGNAGYEFKTNAFGETGKKFHGFQVGITYMPTFDVGFGLYTGLFYENYFCSSDYAKEMGYFYKYKESDLYFPIHALYRFAFSDVFVASVHAGVGNSLGLMGKKTAPDFSDAEGVDFNTFGSNGFPKRYNISGEIGLDMRIGPILLGTSLSRDFTRFTVTDGKAFQNKFSLSAAYTFEYWDDLFFGYDHRFWGLDFSYISKHYESKEGNSSHHTDFLGNYKNNFSGIQMGVRIQPCADWGLGGFFGTYYELYFSSLLNSSYYDSYFEHSLYIPTHAFYRFPIGDDVALSFNGGVGFDIGLSRTLTSSNFYFDNITGYSQEGLPKEFNCSIEYGASIRVFILQLNLQFSKGLINHDLFEGCKSYQNKMTIGLSILF